jgi:hypothetical protein
VPTLRNKGFLKGYPVTRNSLVLESFVEYCIANPNERFYQALRNWAGVKNFLHFSSSLPREDELDTFYFEGRDV